MPLKEKIRFVLSAVLLLVFLWTCWGSLERLWRKEMSRTITILKEDHSDWPSVTICLYPNGAVNASFDEHVKSLPSMKDLLSVRLETGRNHTDTDVFKTSHWITGDEKDGLRRIYQFLTIDIAIKRTNAARVIFSLSGAALLNRTAQLMIHDKGFVNPFSLDVPGIAIVTFETNYISTKIIQYTKTIIVDKSLVSQPCDEKNEQQVTTCLTKYMETAAGRPFQWTQEENDKKSKEGFSEDAFKRFVAAATDLATVNVNDMLIATGCRRNCQYGKYGLEVTYDVRSHDSSKNVTSIHLMSLDPDTKMEKEVFVYTFSDFAADFGGYIGLLLGASVLSIYDQITRVVEHVHRWFTNKKIPSTCTISK